MLKIWGRKTSSNVQAVMWCVAELGLEHERIDAGFNFGVVNTPEYLAMNPNGRVPTIQDGDNAPLWESGAILRYLMRQYASEEFWPADPDTRAQIDMWAEWAKLNIATNFTGPIFWPVVRTAPSKRDPVAIAAGLQFLNGFLSVAEAQLADHKFLAGDRLTIADFQFAHSLFRYFDIDIERADFPNIRSYYDRLAAAENFQEHVMVSYEILRVSD